MTEAFIFDLDGTLQDSEILWVETIQQALREKNCRVSHEKALELVYGKAWSDIYTHIARRFPEVYPTRESMERVTNRIFQNLRATRDIRIKSSLGLLIKLGKNYPVAIVSGSTQSYVAESVKSMGIEPYVRFFLGSEDYTPGKPHPACFLLAAERLKVAPKLCLVFEDSTAGVQAAKAAGMRCIALQRKGRPEQDMSLADEILTDLANFRLETYRGKPTA